MQRKLQPTQANKIPSFARDDSQQCVHLWKSIRTPQTFRTGNTTSAIAL